MYLEDMHVGQTVTLDGARIDKEAMLAFARTYDPHPLHTDEAYAKESRFGRLIAPGVMSFMAVWAKYLEVDFFANELIAGKSTKIEWLQPVFADDVLTGIATITGLTARNPYNGIAEVTIAVHNQDNVLVLSDVTEAIIKRRQEP